MHPRSRFSASTASIVGFSIKLPSSVFRLAANATLILSPTLPPLPSPSSPSDSPPEPVLPNRQSSYSMEQAGATAAAVSGSTHQTRSQAAQSPRRWVSPRSPNRGTPKIMTGKSNTNTEILQWQWPARVAIFPLTRQRLQVWPHSFRPSMSNMPSDLRAGRPP